MKFSLSVALLTAFFVAACSEEPPPQPTRHRMANYPAAGTEQYPPPQQPFNPNGPARPTGTPPVETAASPPPAAAPTKIAKGDYPYGIPGKSLFAWQIRRCGRIPSGNGSEGSVHRQNLSRSVTLPALVAAGKIDPRSLGILLQRSKAGQLRLISDADRRAPLTRSLSRRFHNSPMELRIKRAPRIDIEITVPGDKSISHRAVIIAALSNGVCTLHGFLPSENCMHTVNAMRALGIKIEQPQPDTLIVHGKKRVLTSPKKEIDCGNSGTTMRLLAGLLAGQTFESRLVGDAGLSRRPMDRVIAPLRRMGATILAEGPEQTPPLRIHGGSLRGMHHRLPIASAQVKSALLLAGLFAKGKTTVNEPSPTRNHTEVLFNYFLVRTAMDGETSVTVFGDQVPESRDFTIPGDISSAAFWLVAAAAQPRGHLLVREVGLNNTRTALLGVLLRMGAQVREAIEDVDQLEPRGIVEVTGAPLKGTVIQGREVPQLIDELPILAVAGVLASGKTIIRHAQELRVKETDRIAAIAHNLRTMGAQVTEMNDGLEIDGPAPLHGARVASFSDHRIAMAFAIAGLFAEGETVVQDAECIRQSYPGFGTVLDEFTNLKRMQISTPVFGSFTPTPVEET